MKRVLIFCFVAVMSLPVFSQISDSAGFFYAKGAEEQQSRRFAMAHKYFQQSVDADSTDKESWKALANTALELRQYKKAKSAFERVYELDKNDTTAIHQLAQLNFNFRQWHKAIEFGLLMQQHGQYAGTNYIIGKSFYEDENYGKAFQYLEEAAKDDPVNAQIPYIIAVSYVDMSNYRKAIPYFHKALAIDSNNARWYYEMAMTYSAIPDDKTAVIYYEKAAEKGYKTDNDYFENLSLSCILSGQPERGLQLMMGLLEKKPADLNLLYNIAETYYKIKDYPKAIGYFDNILQQDASNARAMYMMGMAYQKKGDVSRGMKICDRAIELDPSLADLKRKKVNVGL
ncbi:hypothetical protein DC498_19060 [Terrimonas sp.]|uniref:tetratricopeptide repeat protein n=1 Tax=Terrimonas sp. TaxID=1914338 RepID=UPI000D5148B3|nr:tetratricopeptide repeat protein [Terrimonas sp.]PVD50692.1 hypothetical protein DC498_19060 [Terrimonas sp.]